MRKLEGRIDSHLYFTSGKIAKQDIASTDPLEVQTFDDLISKIATLSFLNKDFLLFFRGQKTDHLNESGNSSFYPSIYRMRNGEKLLDNIKKTRFDKLTQASRLLVKTFSEKKIESASDLKKRRLIQWSILQHYEVCDTPLLDLTQSLRVAAAFALDGNSEPGYVFVFGLPYITNRISINSEQEIVNIRLLSICPPQALRPYYQEASLVGTVDVTDDYDERSDLDFKRRLIAKFKINGSRFWGDHTSLAADFMPSNDEIKSLCLEVKQKVEEDNNIQAMFPGRWRNDFQGKEGKQGWEILQIKKDNEYHALGRHLFNIDSVHIDKANGTINFRKVGVAEDRKLFNSLKIINDRHYEGIEGNGTIVIYTRQE